MDVEATVITVAGTELRLTANWPLAWLQGRGTITVLRKLWPGEVFEHSAVPCGRQEIVVQTARTDFQPGDRVIVRL